MTNHYRTAKRANEQKHGFYPHSNRCQERILYSLSVDKPDVPAAHMLVVAALYLAACGAAYWIGA